MDCRNDTDAMSLARRMAALGPGILGVAALGNSVPNGEALSWRVVVMVGGTEGTVRDLAGTVSSSAGTRTVSESEDVSLLGRLAEQPGRATLHISTMPSRTGSGLAELPIEEMVSYPSIGAAYITAAGVGSVQVRRTREGLAPDGELRLLHVTTDLKREAGTWGPTGPDFALMKRVKDVFDPERVMSPGRFVGGL
jgi:glycolate oxidase FAD binding subunit